MKKSADEPIRGRSGLGWFFTAPQAAYSSAEIARIFDWTLREAETHIRLAVRHGELHPFREHTINLFERGEVVAFVEKYHPASAGEMAAAIVGSGYRDGCIPAGLFLRMLEAAKAGHADYAISLATLPRFPGEPEFASKVNPKFPAPHSPRVGSARPDLSNELPSLRTRIRRGSPRRVRRSPRESEKEQ